MLTFSIPFPIIDGIPTPADSALLSNPLGTFGVRRVDTSEVIVADGTALVVNGTDYEYTIANLDGVTYEAWFELDIDGEIYRTAQTLSENPTVIVDGRYATYAGMKSKFGELSLRKWGEVNGADESAYVDAIESAMLYADDRVDAMLSGCRYSVPFTADPGIPTIVRDIANAFAGVHLYENQGVTDFNSETGQPMHKYQWHVKQGEKLISQIKTGLVQLRLADGTPLEYSTNIPNYSEYE